MEKTEAQSVQVMSKWPAEVVAESGFLTHPLWRPLQAWFASVGTINAYFELVFHGDSAPFSAAF